MKNRINGLTRQESIICMKIVSGKSDQDILDELVIESSTLKTHIRNIYRKLEINGFNKKKKLIYKFLLEKE